MAEPVGGPVGAYPDGPASEADGLTDAQLVKLGLAPQTTTVDGTTVVERSIPDLIALDKYLKSRGVASDSDPFAGLRIGVAVLPSARGDH